MANVTLGEMLRLGGFGAYFSFALGVILVVLLVAGFVLAARKGNLKTWGWLVLIAGLLCAFNGGAGTIMGMVRIARFAAGAGGDAAAADILAQGVYEVLYNVVFGFAFAFLALFGYAAVRLVANRRD